MQLASQNALLLFVPLILRTMATQLQNAHDDVAAQKQEVSWGA